MSFLKSKSRPLKYDKASIHFRKEYEDLLRKSKEKYETLKKDAKTEVLLRKDLPGPLSAPEIQPRIDEIKSRKIETECGIPVLRGSQNKTKMKEKRLHKKEELKTKPRLHEKGVVSIRPDNRDLKVVMQGKKIRQKVEEKSPIEQEKLESLIDYADTSLFYRPASSFNFSTAENPVKFAITGSQNTSMPVSLANREPQNKVGGEPCYGASKHALEDNELFIMPWSSEETMKSSLDSSSGRTSRADKSSDLADASSSNHILMEFPSEASQDIQMNLEQMTNENAGVGEFAKRETPLGKDGEEMLFSSGKNVEDVPLDSEKPDINKNICEVDKLNLAESCQETLNNAVEQLNEEKEILATEKQGNLKAVVNNSGHHEQQIVEELPNETTNLFLPLKVTTSEIMNVAGTTAKLIDRGHAQTTTSRSPTAVTFPSTWSDNTVLEDEKPGLKIHRFCSQADRIELPAHLTQISRDMHTINKHRVLSERYGGLQELAVPGAHAISEDVAHIYSQQNIKFDPGEYERNLSELAENILKKSASEEETFENLQKVATDLFENTSDEPALSIEGLKIEMKDDSTRYYWTPAPPKFHLLPSTIRDQMCPAYQGAPVFKARSETEYETVPGTHDDSDDDEDDEETVEAEDFQARQRILYRTHGSLSNIMEQLTRKPAAKSTRREDFLPCDLSNIDSEENEKFLSVLDVRRQMARIKNSLSNVVAPMKTDNDDDDDDFLLTAKNARKLQSQPNLSNERSLCFDSDYNTSMLELDQQTKLLEEAMKEKNAHHANEIEEYEKKEDFLDLLSSMNAGSSQVERTDKMEVITETGSMTTTISKVVFSKSGKTSRKPLQSIQTRSTASDREYLKKKRLMKKKIREELNEPPRIIQRSESLQFLPCERTLTRSLSLPCVLNYNLLENGNISAGEDHFYWVQDEFWYKWLDEVYPPSEATPDPIRDMMMCRSETELPSSAILPNILDEIEVIEPHVDESSRQLYEDLKKETEKVSKWIEEADKNETLALFLSRRGALYRKLGLLKKSWDDLERSIELEPQLLVSRWHRHLLHLLNNNPKKALEDLTFITKRNNTIIKVFLSKAEIYKQLGDNTMAIINYSQAIKLNPDDADVYYNRAALFDEKGDITLALEDYKKAADLLPSKTDAMFNIGLYNFDQKHWPAAEKCFTATLEQDPLNARAYIFRGKTYAKQSDFKASLKDFSSALHLNPKSSEAFFHRGCKLRKINPQKAIQDLSVSLLLDSSTDNLNAFLHRGIIYTDLKRWDEAINDFESALKLNRCIPSAHVNIGLIVITKFENYPRAIKRFSAALRVDPTYVRGYICRAEAYDKIGHVREAVDDFTKVIHLRPDVADYRMSRGKLLLKQNKLELASFHIRQAAELSEGLGGSPTQQAIVHAFLHDYDLAIDVLTKATRINPSTTMLILVGKTCMKAKHYENAIGSFKRAIYNLTPWHPRMDMPLSAAVVYFMIGTCFTQLNDMHGALDAFNSAIKVNPDYAEAYYNRGLTKMKLSHAKCIHDFNRALAINPKLFQAFLSRAVYYGTKGRFSKGIMNCNEAIKLQPRSVRAYLYRGALKFHISAYKLAVRDLTEAIAIDCTCLLAYFNRAVCYQAMKFYQKALIDYSTVLLSSKELDVKVLQNRGLLYLDLDDVENALMDFSQAAMVSPNNPKILHTLGLCYHKLNRLQDSVDCYTKALKLDPFFQEAYIGRGNTLMDCSYSMAIRHSRLDYMKALHINPLYLPARVNLAYNLQVEGKFQQAWNQFTCALSLDKGCQAALEGRAIVNLQMSHTFAAFVDMNECLKISKNAELLTNRGVVQQFMGDMVNAMRDYQSAIRLEPHYSLAYYNAGNLYFKQRQFNQALSYFEKASSWNQKDESAVLNAAITKVLLKQYDSALCDFEKAIQLNPYSAHTYLNRGNLFASLGQYKRAENDYTHALQLKPGDALTYKRRADVRGKLSRRNEAIQDYKMAILIQTNGKKPT